MGMRWFFRDLLSATSGGSDSTFFIRSFELIMSLWSSATHCFSGGLQGLCLTTGKGGRGGGGGGRLWPSFAGYFSVSVRGVTKTFTEACFRVASSVKRRKLKWYGHVTRSSGLAKTILQGTVQGGRRRGRQRKRWEDNIKEWTGLEWNILPRKAENREEWRKLAVNSIVVPQRSARLRNR